MDQKLLTLMHTIGTTLLLIFSFLIFCPLAILLGRFHGHCIIGAEITFPGNNQTETVATDMAAAKSKCTYPEFMGVVMLFYSIGYLAWNAFLIVNSWQSPGRDSFGGTLLSGLLTFMLLVSSCLLSAGNNRICKELEEHNSCEYYNNRPDNWLIYFNQDSQFVPAVDPEGFYSLLKLAEVASWLSFIVMLGMLAVYVLKLKTSSNGQEFLASITSERTRLSQDNQRRYDQI